MTYFPFICGSIITLILYFILKRKREWFLYIAGYVVIVNSMLLFFGWYLDHLFAHLQVEIFPHVNAKDYSAVVKFIDEFQKRTEIVPRLMRASGLGVGLTYIMYISEAIRNGKLS